MEFPEELRNEPVLSFKFKRTSASWKPMQKRPDILRLTDQDCSQDYRKPKLLGNLDHAFVEVRVYDEKGINTAAGADQIAPEDETRTMARIALTAWFQLPVGKS